MAPFQLEEIKEAVWDCESSKSPCPDGVNFGFIKEIWFFLGSFGIIQNW